MTSMPSPSVGGSNAVPAEVAENFYQRLHTDPTNPAYETWLLDLIKNSGHLSSPDNLRWRTLAMIWVAMVFDVDAVWPYMQWFNNGETDGLTDALADILSDAVDDYNAYIVMAAWITKTNDERLQNFFHNYQQVPGPESLKKLFQQHLPQPANEAVEYWLRGFLDDTSENTSPYMRPWRLAAAAWYAAGFDADAGLAEFEAISGQTGPLNAENRQILRKNLSQAGILTALLQAIAEADDDRLRQTFEHLGQPPTNEVVNQIFSQSPDYSHLTPTSADAEVAMTAYKRLLQTAKAHQIDLYNGPIVDINAGELAPMSLLLHSNRYPAIGVGSPLPPQFLPLQSFAQRFKRNKYVAAWQNATQSYYKSLADLNGGQLNWKKLDLRMGYPSKLPLEASSAATILAFGSLYSYFDVSQLLYEVKRILKPGGWFIAEIIPFTALRGGFSADPLTKPWEHLQSLTYTAPHHLNRWTEKMYREQIKAQLNLISWETVQDPDAEELLANNPALGPSAYPADELTRERIMVIAQKNSP